MHGGRGGVLKSRAKIRKLTAFDGRGGGVFFNGGVEKSPQIRVRHFVRGVGERKK